jgi:2-keto-4-pentenoate hydratase/2-oxohepta-3-ene-1,7-dioic acid hydratase in catechol pathway
VEYAAELAVVLGKRARRVAPDEAAQVVFGYTCANDVTARDLAEQDGVRARAKSYDATCPLGPNLTTGLDPAELLITCRVNGETRQMSSTRDMLFTVPQVIAFVSAIMTLLPGDVILMGAPAGVGTLAEGDVVEVEIEAIGKLSNPVASNR